MPILKDGNDTWTLYCINGHRKADGTTEMVAVQGPLAISKTEPTATGLTQANRGVLVNCYFCNVCGYAELYLPLKPEVVQNANPDTE